MRTSSRRGVMGFGARRGGEGSETRGMKEEEGRREGGCARKVGGEEGGGKGEARGPGQHITPISGRLGSAFQYPRQELRARNVKTVLWGFGCL